MLYFRKEYLYLSFRFKKMEADKYQKNHLLVNEKKEM